VPDAPGFAAQVRMQNFMTYNDVSVQPGPRLNLILGPNGTGASLFTKALVLCALSSSRDRHRHRERPALGHALATPDTRVACPCASQARAPWCAPSASAWPAKPTCAEPCLLSYRPRFVALLLPPLL
jgi:hypothetical protein